VSVAEEVGALRSSAGRSSADHVALAQVDGPGAFHLLERACTQPLHLREGRARHTLLLRDDAGIFADVLIGLADDGYYVLAEGPNEAELVAWLEGVRDRTLAARDTVIRGLSAETVALGVDGPYAWEVVAGLLGPAVLGMPYLTLLRREDVLCLRAGKTGEYGYLVLAPRPSADELHSKLVEAGRLLGFELATVGLGALDVCALENWHFSIRTCRETRLARPLTPIELQLQWRVAYDKDFVGAEALRARRAEGARWRATCFTAEGPVAPGQAVSRAGEDVGEVLAACFSPTLGAWIGSALLRRCLAHPHVALAVSAEAGPIPITTRTTPLVDNQSLHVDPHKHSFATRGALASSAEPAP
jgi:glycine cleavage system aminomethyltransferase T